METWETLNEKREELVAELELAPWGSQAFEDRFREIEHLEARMRLVG